VKPSPALALPVTAKPKTRSLVLLMCGSVGRECRRIGRSVGRVVVPGRIRRRQTRVRACVDVLDVEIEQRRAAEATAANAERSPVRSTHSKLSDPTAGGQATPVRSGDVGPQGRAVGALVEDIAAMDAAESNARGDGGTPPEQVTNARERVLTLGRGRAIRAVGAAAAARRRAGFAGGRG